MVLSIRLPESNGELVDYQLSGVPISAAPPPYRFNRTVFAAAHVVADPLAATEPACGAVIDWETTLAYRRYLLDLGFGIAEAMDTAQRGMGLDWPQSLELIERSVAAVAPQERSRIY